ncbi:MAG: helix-turn-helix transcriptional regulator [Bacteroidales bacterium]|nr:helix-turn-helix transcriptional regulator [Bacteroidales bacterium]
MTNKKTQARLYTSPILDEIQNMIDPNDQEKTNKRMLLAAKIYDAMEAKGWKNKDLAEALNKKRSVITKWLSGTHNFTQDTLCDIERVLDINLLNLDTEPKEPPIHFVYTIQTQHKGIPANILNERVTTYQQTSNISINTNELHN